MNLKEIVNKDGDMPVSARYLAHQSGVRPDTIHYWARKGFIRTRGDGSKTPYYLSDLRKVQLMNEIISNLKLEAQDASELADRILSLLQERPDQYETAIALVQMFTKSLDVLTELLTQLGFNEALKNRGLGQIGKRI